MTPEQLARSMANAPPSERQWEGARAMRSDEVCAVCSRAASIRSPLEFRDGEWVCTGLSCVAEMRNSRGEK